MRWDASNAERVFRRAMRLLGWEGARILLAQTFSMRLRGMIGRPPDPSMAMAFPRCRSVHTWFMACPLDIVFIDKEGEIVEIHCGVKPYRTLSCRGAWGVIERVSRPLGQNF